MKRPISDGLKVQIGVMRETALQLRDQMSSPTIKTRLDLALANLDEIPRLKSRAPRRREDR